MNDSVLSVVLIFAELGGVLLLALIVVAFRYIRSSKKDAGTTSALIDQIKKIIPKHRDQLKDYFKGNTDEVKVDFDIETLMKDERKIYERLIKVSITKNIDLLKLTTEDINSLINNYVRLLALKVESETNSEKESRILTFKKENESLRLEIASLKSRLDISNESLENMMGEFSSMYEGGKKEGEQRLKNEMYQLKQSLETEEAKVKSEIKELDEKEDD